MLVLQIVLKIAKNEQQFSILKIFIISYYYIYPDSLTALNIEELRDHCLLKPGVTEGFPFDEDTLVFKVGRKDSYGAGKMFLLTGLESGNNFNVKCDPDLAVELREKYTEVQPGYHMNKKMWNTVYMDGSLTRKQLLDMVDHSYELVFNGLPKKIQAEIQGY